MAGSAGAWSRRALPADPPCPGHRAQAVAPLPFRKIIFYLFPNEQWCSSPGQSPVPVDTGQELQALTYTYLETAGWFMFCLVMATSGVPMLAVTGLPRIAFTACCTPSSPSR
jgi:hypothetical protein